MFPTPQELGDVFHAAHGHPRQVHLDERLLHGRFPAPVALYDGGLERGQAQFRDGYVEFPGASEQFPMVVPAAVVLADFGTFMPLRVAEACRLLVQHGVERILDRAPDERFQVVLESGFVDFDSGNPLVEFAKENIRHLSLLHRRKKYEKFLILNVLSQNA